MGIDAKEIGILVWKILGSSLNITLKFMKNHPGFSGVSIFLLTLYVFLPSVFYFLIYSSPVLACVVVFAQEKLNSGRPGSRNTDDKPSSSLEAKKSRGERSVVRSHLIQQRSVRRNARMKVDKWDSQTSDDDKDKVILTSLYNDLLGRTPHFEESPKAVEADVVDKEKEEASHGGDSSQSLRSSGPSYHNLVVLDGEKPTVSSCESKEEDKEMNDKEDRSEQKNSGNEPGISEMERNKRLESLIARRRARRLFKLAADQKNMMRGDEMVSPIQNFLQISVPKNNGSLLRNHRNNASDDFISLQMPGSAPSVLLPMRNPFDIPYDPQEERPILKGDSFDLEFSAFNQKDMFFCRHESFCRSALFSPEPVQYINSPNSASDRKCLGNDYENRVEQELPDEGEKATMTTKMAEDKEGSVESDKSSKRASKVNDETDSDKESDNDSSSSGESEREFNALNKDDLREAIRQSMGTFSGFLVNQARNNIPSPLPRGVPPRLDDHHLFYARRCGNSHTRTFSIASDLQVEVSEIGSPPTTVDWHDDSSNGGESYMYDTDIDREIDCGEELRKRDSHQSESKLRSETRSNEENNGSELGTSGIEEKLVSKTIAERDLKHGADKQLKRDDDEALLDRKGQIDEHRKQVVEEVTDQKRSNSSDAFEHENLGRLEHTLFCKSTSLSSIAEEPETILDPIDVGNQESVKHVFEELIGGRPLSSLDSPTEKLGDDEADLQDMAQNEEFRGSAERIDSEINGHAEKVKEEEKHGNFTEDADGERPDTLYNHNKNNSGLNNIQGDNDTELVQECESDKVNDRLNVSEINQNVRVIEKGNTPDGDVCSGMLDNSAENIESEAIDQPEQEVAKDREMKSFESTDENAEGPTEIENTQNGISMSPDHPHTNSREREVVEEEELKVVENAEKNAEPMEHEGTRNVLNISMGHPRMESLEQELVEEQEAKFVEEKAKPTEHEEAQNVLNASGGHPHTESLQKGATEEKEPKFVENILKKAEQMEHEEPQEVANISPGHLRTVSLESELLEKKEPKFVEEKAQPIEHEETQNALNTSLGHPQTGSLEIELLDENEPKFADNKAEPMEHEETQNAPNAYADHLHTGSLEREVTAEKEQNFVKNTYQTTEEPMKQGLTLSVPGASPDHPYTKSVEDCPNRKMESDVIVLQVNKDSSLQQDESNEREILKEGETSRLIEDNEVESAQGCNKKENVEEALVVSENNQNSHGSVAVAESSEPWIQQGLVDSSRESSSGTSSVITQQPEPGDTASNIDKDIVGHTQEELPGDETVNVSSELSKVARDPTIQEQKEENLKLIEQSGKAKEEELELK